MKLILTFLTVIGFSVQLHAQDESESERIKALISELSKKAVESRLQLKKLHSQFSENHPKIRGIESQLSEIANAKTELASKLAMIQLSDVHKELKNHASILTKQLASIKEMMKSKVDADFKKEYGKIQEHALKVIQMIKEHVNEKHKDVAKELKSIFAESNIDPEKIAKSYDRAIFESLGNAIAKKRDKALIELKAAKSAQEESEQINKDLEMKIRELEERLAREKAVADEQTQMIEIEKKKADQTKSAFEDALRIADLKLKKFAVEKLKMDQAINSAKTIRSTSKNEQVQKLNDLYSKLSKVKNENDKASKSVDSRLKKVEADVSKIKSLLEDLIKKIK